MKSYIVTSGTKSYTLVRKEREEFRKRLVDLIIQRKDCSELDDDENSFPNAHEKEILRYYYYIKYGVDTIHVAPMNKKVVTR